MSKTFNSNPPSYAKLAIRALNQLATSGGFSFNDLGESPTTGYMVSLPSENRPIVASARNVAQFLQANPISGAEYWGGWQFGQYQETDGAVYLDRSINVISKREALAIAKQNKQLAIYDVRTGQSVYVRKQVATKRQCLARLVRLAITRSRIADEVYANEWETDYYWFLRLQAAKAIDSAEDVSAQIGESAQAFNKRYDRIERSIRNGSSY